MTAFFEAMFFSPKWYHYVVMTLLFPLSVLYGAIMFIRRVMSSKKYFSIPIVSIGNLQVGGSGKTPFVIALASRYEDVTIISRGYGRQSTGLVEVSYKGKVVVNVKQSGDEPMLMAQSLPHASVIVSEDRNIAIELAMREGAKLIEPECTPNTLPFPAGPQREFTFTKRYANIVAKEKKLFNRVVEYENLSDKMLLVTAISNPSRLDSYLPKGVVGKVYLEDHAYFNENALKGQMLSYGAKSLLVTQKDAVKMQEFKLPLSLMKLKLEVDDTLFMEIDRYIKNFKE